jgi:hypothetical protein
MLLFIRYTVLMAVIQTVSDYLLLPVFYANAYPSLMRSSVWTMHKS